MKKREYTAEDQRAAGERVTNAIRAELGKPPVKIPPRDPKEYGVSDLFVFDPKGKKVMW